MSSAFRSSDSTDDRLSCGRLHVGPIESDPVAAGVLGVIHRRVGVHDQRLRVVAVFRIERDADARGQHQLVPRDEVRLGDRRHNLLRDQPGVLGLIDFRQEDQELVAAVTADGVRLADARHQALRDRAQDLVADGVTERIVDVLETIAVEEQDRDAAAVAARQRDGAGEAIVQEQPVRQVRQRVVFGQVQHFQPALARHDDVAEDDHRAQRVALPIVNRRRGMFDRRLVTVPADEDVVPFESDFLLVLHREARRVLCGMAGQVRR